MPDEMLGRCQLCEQEVAYGEPCVTVNLHEEKYDPVGDTDGDGAAVVEVTVLQSQAAVLLCRKCGQTLDGSFLRGVVEDRRGRRGES